MPATYHIAVDWDGDGDFGDTGEDVTGRALLRRTPLTTRAGRDQARALSPIAPGEATLEVNNVSRDYSPENSGSPLAGQVRPGRGVLATATLGGTDYVLFRGVVDDLDVRADQSRSVQLTCVDALGRLKGLPVTTSLYSGLRTGEAIAVVLDAAGVPEDGRDIDIGATVTPWFWADAADAYDTIVALAGSDGPGALLGVDADGRIVYRDRHHRLTDTASLTSQATWRDSGAEPLYSAPAVYDHGWRDIVNSVTISVPLRQVASARSVVWQAGETLSIADGETVVLTARAGEPFTGALTPVAGVDYTLMSGAVSVSMSRTSGQSTTLSVRASGGPAQVADLQVRAYTVTAATTRMVTVEEPVSVGRYGRRTLPADREPAWIGVHDALAVGELILAQRAERLPTLQVTFRGGHDARLAEQLGRTLSDRVTVANAETVIDRDFYVEQVRHEVSESGLWHHTTFGLEAVPADIDNVFRFDTAGQGFGQGVFGGIGRDDPSTMFRFDTAGQGFGQGVFAH